MDFSIRWKKFFIVCLLFAISFGAFAQQNHFIYLQTENNQLFYVKLNGQVTSSSSAGYLILSNLPDGPLQLTVGFPRNEFPEEKFDLSVDNKNKGFLLKNLNDKGWVLFNLQSLTVIDRSSIETPATVIKTTKKEDAFSTLLANAVNDTSLFQHNNTIANQQQPNQANQVVSNDSSSDIARQIAGVEIALPSVNNQNKLNDTVSNNIASTLPVNTPDRIKVDTLRISDTVFVKGEDAVNKILGVNESAGMDMIYTVKKPSGEDTVRIFLPATQVNKSPDSLDIATNNIVGNEPKDSVLTITPTVIPLDYIPAEQASRADSTIPGSVNTDIAKSDSLIENKESISQLNNKQIEEPVSDEVHSVSKPESEIIVMPQAVTSSEVNSDCNSFATDQDFLKVRKKMAGTTGRENMIEAARKFFKLKCYSTEQIKNLSYLFLTDEGKYLFFDMAYAFASDSNLYETLQSQFEDPYYLNRFKAMIRK